MVSWTENISMRRGAYEGGYFNHALRGIIKWFLWLEAVIILLIWRTGSAPWSHHGWSSIVFCGLCGLLIRIMWELGPRKVEIDDSTFKIHHITWFRCPTGSMSNVKFIPIDNELFSMHCQCRNVRGRTRRFIIGVPRRAAMQAMDLFGGREIAGDSEGEQETQIEGAAHSRELASRVHTILFQTLGGILICAAVVVAIEGFFSKNVAFAGAAAGLGLVAGLMCINIQPITKWCLRTLGRKDEDKERIERRR